MKKFQAFLGAFIFLTVGVLVGWGIPHPTIQTSNITAQTSANAVREVSIMFDEGDGTVKTFEHQSMVANENLFATTKRIAEANHLEFRNDPPGKYGILITNIDGKQNGTAGAYWGYWVNDHLGEVASDAYRLQPGDVIEWKFVKLKF